MYAKIGQPMGKPVDYGIHLGEGQGGPRIGPRQERALRPVRRLVLKHMGERPVRTLKVRRKVREGQHAGLA